MILLRSQASILDNNAYLLKLKRVPGVESMNYMTSHNPIAMLALNVVSTFMKALDFLWTLANDLKC